MESFKRLESMKTKNILIVLTVISVGLLSFQKRTTTLYMVGDSTMANKLPKAFPETGWGMPFTHYFDNTVVVDNRAQNGRSTKSFIAEGRWNAITEKLKEGDYVFIEFGHNDEKVDKPAVGTSLEEFKTNLVKYVTEARVAKAIPILLTPVNRLSVDSATGKFKDTHKGYPDVIRSVAKEYNVPLIDMYVKTEKLFTTLGYNESKKFFNRLEPGENANYPNGVKDNTHFSPYGAEQIAKLAAEGLKELHIELAERLIEK
jgi:lysophospholipase L1-like esterase